LSVAVIVGGAAGAASAAERSGFGAGVVLVVELFVGCRGVEIDRVGGCGARRRGLVGEVECAAGEVAEDGGTGIEGEVAGEREGEGVDGAGGADHREGGSSGIVAEDDVGHLFSSDARAADFDHVFAGGGVEAVVAETAGGSGIGERLSERRIGVDWGEGAGLAGNGYGADANGGSDERDPAGIEDNVVLAGALCANRGDSGQDMEKQRESCGEKTHGRDAPQIRHTL